MKRKKRSISDKESPCSKCGQGIGAVIHCRSCCGWGITKDIKYHKFASIRAERASREESKP